MVWWLTGSISIAESLSIITVFGQMEQIIPYCWINVREGPSLMMPSCSKPKNN